jgi:hypothetical protein
VPIADISQLGCKAALNPPTSKSPTRDLFRTTTDAQHPLSCCLARSYQAGTVQGKLSHFAPAYAMSCKRRGRIAAFSLPLHQFPCSKPDAFRRRQTLRSFHNLPSLGLCRHTCILRSVLHCCTNCWVCALQWASLYPSRKYPGSQSCDSGGVTTGCFGILDRVEYIWVHSITSHLRDTNIWSGLHPPDTLIIWETKDLLCNGLGT